ncbi:MAG: type 2 isopentenyl-diphosphate Delta-isomerase [Nanobdellota archaeon]
MTAQRKRDHIDICSTQQVEQSQTTGFERYHFPHQALPETDLAKIDLSTTFLGKQIKAPLLISSMTGGYDHAGTINANLAKAAQALGIPLCLGSMRIALEDQHARSSFNIRHLAPSIPILANVGAVQLNYGYTEQHLKEIIEIADADALILHLNPLQEAIQPEGDTNFKGLKEKINNLNLPVPLIIKEVGCGISQQTASELNCDYIDTAGVGGTSWAAIEGIRANSPLGETFRDWGIPTAQSILECRRTGKQIIASGGIRNGMDAAKAIALGADMVGLALPLLDPATKDHSEVVQFLENIIKELRITLFCTGAQDLDELRQVKLNGPGL